VSILLGFALFYRVNGVIAGCMRYLSPQGEYYAVTHSNLDMDCVEHHLKDLLEGAVTTWVIVAEVTASHDRPETQVSNCRWYCYSGHLPPRGMGICFWQMRRLAPSAGPKPGRGRLHITDVIRNSYFTLSFFCLESTSRSFLSVRHG
jgi:hypothetical protein